MDDDGRQSRARKVVSFTVSPEASGRLDELAEKLRASRSVVVELLVLGAKSVARFRKAADLMMAANKDRRYAGRRGWETRRLGERGRAARMTR